MQERAVFEEKQVGQNRQEAGVEVQGQGQGQDNGQDQD